MFPENEQKINLHTKIEIEYHHIETKQLFYYKINSKQWKVNTEWYQQLRPINDHIIWKFYLLVNYYNRTLTTLLYNSYKRKSLLTSFYVDLIMYKKQFQQCHQPNI